MATVVFFGAHADDIEIGAGGTCAKLAAAGFDVHVVIATDEADPSSAERRRGEARNAAAMMGVPAAKVHFLGHPDGDMRCTRAAVGALRSALTRAGVRPTAVFTHTDVDSHNDHVELSRMVRAAMRQCLIFKYIVRNSAVVSHFKPTLYSRIDSMLGAKARALVAHMSQVAAGRVSIDKLLEFSKRFTVADDGVHLEAFEVEVQDGATGYAELLDVINDAPFSRFWAPVYRHGDLTILPGDGSRTLWAPPYEPRSKNLAPGTLELVIRLQSMLLGTFAADTERNLKTFVRVAPQSAALPSDVSRGTLLILGSAAANPAAAAASHVMSQARYAIVPATGRRNGLEVVDAATGRSRRPGRALDRGRGKASREIGLLTIGRLLPAGDEPRFAIHVDGTGAAAFAAAFQCLTLAEGLERIVPIARDVFAGRMDVAQWVVPASLAGLPEFEAIECSTKAVAKLPVRRGPPSRAPETKPKVDKARRRAAA